MRIGDLLNPKNDYVFKRIFGHLGNEYITKQMLQTIIETSIESITLSENTILGQNLLNDKIGIVDIHIKINNEIDVDIEMQVVREKNIEKRLLYYWSKLYTEGINKGQDYNKLHKTITILIADFKIDKLKEIPKICTKWQIREEKHQSVILTDILEVYIIEVPKIKDKKESAFLDSPKEMELIKMNKVNEKETNFTDLKGWLMFLNNPENVDFTGMSEENKEAIKKAKKVLEEISADEHERYLANLREKYIMDQKAIQEYGYDNGLEDGLKRGIEQGLEDGLKKGREQGLGDGIKRGVEQGVKDAKKQIAKEMIKQNVSIEFIMSVTKLTKEEIEKLK